MIKFTKRKMIFIVLIIIFVILIFGALISKESLFSWAFYCANFCTSAEIKILIALIGVIELIFVFILMFFWH